MRQVIVTGGRDYADKDTLYKVLDRLNPIIHGGAKGADSLAERWAKDNGVEYHVVPADWNKHGKAAGPIRNREMLTSFPCALVVAFPGGKGTANCISIARELNMPVLTSY